MPSILFVCMANQFRSPLAAAFFEKRLLSEGVRNGWTISSAGTWVKEICGAHPAAIREARKIGMDLSQHRSREVTREMIASADLVVVMEHGQKVALQFEFPSERSKIFMLSELAGNGEVNMPDPSSMNFAESDEIAAELSRELNQAYPEIIQRVHAQV